MKLIFFKGKYKKKESENGLWAVHRLRFTTACVGHKLTGNFCTEKDNMYCVVMLCKIKKNG